MVKRVPGLDEEVVEQQAGQQRRQRGGGHAAEQRDDEHADEEQRALAADAEEGVEQRARSVRRWPTARRARPARTPGAGGAGDSDDQRRPALGLLVGDHVDVDLARSAAPTAAPMPSSKMRAHRDRREVPRTSWVAFISRAKSSSAAGTSSPDDGVHRGAEAGRQLAHLAHLRRGHAGQPVAAHDVHDHQLGARLRCDPRRPAHQRLRLRAAGDGDDDALAGLPGVGDVVVGAVLGERGVDLVGQPQQRELAQRGQVAAPEVVATARRRCARARRRCRGKACAATLPA